MKNNLLCLFPLLLIALITPSCSKDKNLAPAPLPTGAFSGYFEVFHLNPRTNKRDTAFEWVTLTLSGANGFTISGDSTVHAGSTNIQVAGYGSYALDGAPYMQFSDKSLPATAVANAPSPSKYHLNGLYIGAYSAGYVEFIGTFADTLAVTYNLSLNQEPVK